MANRSTYRSTHRSSQPTPPTVPTAASPTTAFQTTTKRSRLGLSTAALLLTLALPTTLFGCDTCGEKAGDDVVGEVGDGAISYAEVEAHAAAELAPIEEQRDTILRRHLDALVAERLLDLEAATQGIDTTALRQREIANRVEPVTDAEIEAFYNGNRNRIRQPLPQVSEDIRRHLTAQRTADVHAGYVSQLSERYGVTLDWQPYRFDVASTRAPFKGRAEAPVDVVVFSDFQCPWCSRFAPDLEKLTEKYPTDVRLTYRHLPLTSIHPQAQAAAEAAVCAAEQEAFWPVHDAIFARQAELATLDYSELAKDLDLDTVEFGACLESDRPASTIAEDLKDAMAYGITSTPSLFVNGRKLQLTKATPILDQIAAVVDEELGK